MDQKKILRQNTEIDLKQMKRKFYQKKQPNFNHIIIQQKYQTRFQKIAKKNICLTAYLNLSYALSVDYTAINYHLIIKNK